jgi:two-component sensor histidine kinase
MHGTKLTLEKASPREDIVISEIQHRVKNHLQVIISLINLQLARTGDQDVVRPLEATLSRVKAIAALHERSYATPDFATIHMGPYLNDLMRDVSQTYDPKGRINVNIETADLALDTHHAIPVALISNELAVNAFQHAFPNGGSGSVSLRLTYSDSPQEEGEGGAVLEISDDGVGLPDQFNIQTADSMSCELIRILASQLRAKLDVNTGPVGTSYRITFPV